MRKEKPKVYLAGKITNDWWRNEIFGIYEKYNHRTPGIDVYGYDSYEENENYLNSEYDAGEFIVTGPHSIGCDHSCYHKTHHAATKSEHTCGIGEYGIEPNTIFNACLKQINKSDVVFAYITSQDVYGTIFELGYAYRMHNPVYIAFKNDELKKLFWFIAESAIETEVIHRKGDLKNFFDKIIKEYE